MQPKTARRKLDRDHNNALDAIERPMTVRAGKNVVGDRAVNFSPTGC
jgi:hypothetical protein